MAVCLFPDCGYSRARSLRARTARIVDRDSQRVIERQGFRRIWCPLCRRMSKQRIIHDGEADTSWLSDPGDCERCARR